MSCDDIGVGADQRSSKTILKFDAYRNIKRGKNKLRNPGGCLRGWKPCNEKRYHELLDVELRALPVGDSFAGDLQSRCQDTERILVWLVCTKSEKIKRNLLSK